MPRARLIVAAILLAMPGARPAAAVDPHLDRGLVPGGCRACHAGHGASRSPMLPKPQVEICLDCHDSQARADQQVRAGNLAPGARPQLLGATLILPFTHPVSAVAFSRHEAGAVTCSSCHSPHRRGARGAPGPREGVPELSARDPRRLEHELCESCHGSDGPQTQSLTDTSRLFEATSRSFHPVHLPTEDRAPSTRSELRGRQINCTDCHGSSSSNGPRGPHGSAVQSILSLPLVDLDGSEESVQVYALCYSCHTRGEILSERSRFPLHRQHVVDEKAACSTCHSAHGSAENRALIRFGEETERSGVAPSASTERLAFLSDSPGSGSCYVTCHGVDHAPKAYGAAERVRQAKGAARALPPSATVPDRERGRGRPDTARPRREAGPPPPR